MLQLINQTWLFYYFKFKRSYNVLKSKSPCILLNKNINLYIQAKLSNILVKTKQNRNWEIPDRVLERRTLCFSSYKNHKLKVKLWWVGVRERKERVFFVTFILPKENFFKICVLSHFQNIHTFFKKHYFINFCCLFLKFSKAFRVSLRSEVQGVHKIWDAFKVKQNGISCNLLILLTNFC